MAKLYGVEPPDLEGFVDDDILVKFERTSLSNGEIISLQLSRDIKALTVELKGKPNEDTKEGCAYGAFSGLTPLSSPEERQALKDELTVDGAVSGVEYCRRLEELERYKRGEL